MSYFTNTYTFPAIQIALVVVLLWALFRDKRASGFATVTRAESSMSWLDKIAGLAVAVIVTVMNKGVFDTAKEIANYSVAISVFDYFAIAYLCFYSSWGRNKIIGLKPKQVEKR